MWNVCAIRRIEFIARLLRYNVNETKDILEIVSKLASSSSWSGRGGLCDDASRFRDTQESDSLMQIRIVRIFPCDQFERSFVASAWLNNERIIIDDYRYIKYEDKN